MKDVSEREKVIRMYHVITLTKKKILRRTILRKKMIMLYPIVKGKHVKG